MAAAKRKRGELVTAIQFHLDGTITVSPDYGATWKPFKGLVFNAALIEYTAELAYMREQQQARETDL